MPDKVKPDTYTLFLEIDDTILHTYLYDENFGFMSDPAPREPEYKFTIGERNVPIKVYARPYMKEFLQFLKENKDIIEPIIYTSGMFEYAEKLMDIIDPKREIFEHVLY